MKANKKLDVVAIRANKKLERIKDDEKVARNAYIKLNIKTERSYMKTDIWQVKVATGSMNEIQLVDTVAKEIKEELGGEIVSAQINDGGAVIKFKLDNKNFEIGFDEIFGVLDSPISDYQFGYVMDVTYLKR